jgi:CelD/BcsL family acetyltransferase involved in cellulose biosynthesis
LVLLRIHKALREVTEPLRLVVLKEIPEDEDLRQQWNDLALRIDQPQVFYTYEWSLAMQRAYRATLQSLILLGYSESESLVGVASLATDAYGRVSFLCANTGDYCDFLSTTEHKTEFVATVLAELRRRKVRDVTLTNLPSDSGTVAALREASRQYSYLLFARTAYICTQVLLNQLERQPEANKPVLPGKKMVRRSLAALGREVPVRLDHARTWDSLSLLLPAFVNAHVARFQGTGRVSNLARPERRAFLEELAKLISPLGWFVLTRMMSGERVIAWHCGFQFQDTWFWYQPTFDRELEKYSPGFCLLAKIIEEAADNSDLKVVDMGLGQEEYKERFANRRRKTLYVTLRSSAAKHMGEILRYRTTEMLKNAPALELRVRKVSAHLRRIIEVPRRPRRENEKK